MKERGYTLLDFTLPPSLGPDRDRIVRFMEYVRSNLDRLVQDIPAGLQVDLFASGHAHNTGIAPLIGLWAPPGLHDQVPDPFQIIEKVSAWGASLAEAEVNKIVANTTAPTWEELVRIGMYPPSKLSLRTGSFEEKIRQKKTKLTKEKAIAFLRSIRLLLSIICCLFLSPFFSLGIFSAIFAACC